MEKAYCSVCNEMVEVEISSKMEAHVIQGSIIKCDTENAYCLHCHSQVYILSLEDCNHEKLINEYKKKAR